MVRPSLRTLASKSDFEPVAFTVTKIKAFLLFAFFKGAYVLDFDGSLFAIFL